MHPFICLIGPSGSGKTTLMRAAMARIQRPTAIVLSHTTRAPRADDPDDLNWYAFITHEEMLAWRAEGRLLSDLEYAGNAYAFDRQTVVETLTRAIGFAAVVEPVLPLLHAGGIPTKIVLVKPVGQTDPRTAARAAADAARTYAFDADLIIENRFDAGGLEAATDALVAFVNALP